MAGGAADEMKGPIFFPCIVRIGGEDRGNPARRGEAGEALAIGEAGEAPRSAIAVETDIVVGGIEPLGSTAGEIGPVDRVRPANGVARAGGMRPVRRVGSSVGSLGSTPVCN